MGSLVEQYRILGESGEGFKQANPNRFNSRFNFDDVNGDPRSVFVNAVYFKADWQFAFNVHLTYRAKFNLAKGHSIDAQFMGTIANVRVLDVARRKLRILELPYEHPDRSMLIVLPDEETSTENLAKRLQGLDFTNIRTDEEPTETYISIPKFEFKFKTDLKEHMEQLGVRDLFSEASADLSGISNEHLFASQGVHQALIKVNEEGTEAQWPKAGVVSRLHKLGLRMHLGRQKAAAAAVAMFYKSAPPRWLNQLFIADRPFLFIVYDFEHKMTLFAGKVADPNKQELSKAELLPVKCHNRKSLDVHNVPWCNPKSQKVLDKPNYIP